MPMRIRDMTEADLRELEPGALISHQSGGPVYMVTGCYGGRVTAVRTVDVTNAAEWLVLSPPYPLPEGSA